MAGKQRNHFIPRFLLNRFASRRDGNKRWIWQLLRRGDPKEVSTRDAAVQSQFYGGPETGVENGFGVAESQFGLVLQLLDRGVNPNEHSDVLRELLWTLSIRTQALRKQFAETADKLVSSIVDSAFSEQAREAIIRHLRSNFDALVGEIAAELPTSMQTRVRALLTIPAMRELTILLAEQNFISPELRALVVRFGQLIRDDDRLSHSASVGQIRGLAGFLNARRVPELFTPSSWIVRSVAPGRLILGDGCVVAISKAGGASLLLQASQSWRSVYLPISPSTLLVGEHSGAAVQLSVEDMNRASAELSWSHIYSSQVSEHEIGLSNLIGSGAAFLTEAQLSRLVADAWSNFQRGTGQSESGV